MSPNRTEVREVVVDDPHLSPGANAALTADARQAIGADRVEVPRDRPSPSHGEYREKDVMGGVIVEYRPLLGITFLALIVVGAILTLITHDWWFLPIAAGIHAACTMLVVKGSLNMTTSRERPAPTTVAIMEEEGIHDAEGHFSDIVAEFTDGDRRDAGDLIAEGASDQPHSAIDDHAAHSAAQQTAMTPSATGSEPVDEGSLPHVLISGIVAGLVVLSLVVAIALEGAYWFIPAIIVPCALAWVGLRRLARPHEDPEREDARRRLTPNLIMIGTPAAVTVFCLLVALFMSVH